MIVITFYTKNPSDSAARQIHLNGVTTNNNGQDIYVGGWYYGGKVYVDSNSEAGMS